MIWIRLWQALFWNLLTIPSYSVLGVNTGMDREVLQRDLYQLLEWSKKSQMLFNTSVVSRPFAAAVLPYTTIRHSPAFHHISCHGCSQWWTPQLGSSFPRQSSSTSLRSFVSCTGWRLQNGLHSNNQSSCSVYTWVRTCIPYWRALSGGRCRGSSATPFQFIYIIDCQPHPTPYCRWPSFPGRRCTCLEQSARSCHFRTFRSSLPVPA